MLNGPDQLCCATAHNLTGTGNAALAHIEQFGASANWQTLASELHPRFLSL